LNRIRHVSDQVSDLAPHGDDKKKNPGTEQYGPNDRNTEHGKIVIMNVTKNNYFPDLQWLTSGHHECYEE
jgi:hypothetical protein